MPEKYCIKTKLPLVPFSNFDTARREDAQRRLRRAAHAVLLRSGYHDYEMSLHAETRCGPLPAKAWAQNVYVTSGSCAPYQLGYALFTQLSTVLDDLGLEGGMPNSGGTQLVRLIILDEEVLRHTDISRHEALEILKEFPEPGVSGMEGAR